MTLAKHFLAAVLSGTVALSTAPVASADSYREEHHYYEYNDNDDFLQINDWGDDNDFDAGAALAAGVIGLAAGAIIVGSMNKPDPVPVYQAPPVIVNPARPAPVYHRPYTPRYKTHRYEPWTKPWYRYCLSKYRSFDPKSGTYMTYRGVRKFCQ